MAPAPPATKQFTVSQLQYQNILDKLHNDHEVTEFHEDKHSGTVLYEGVEFYWQYDGTGVLRVTSVRKEGLAELVPDSVIFQRIQTNLIDPPRLGPALHRANVPDHKAVDDGEVPGGTGRNPIDTANDPPDHPSAA